MSNDKSTKLKILETANFLFAKYGFGNTSVREIAQQADVNLSAINYHFKNKETLYWKVFDYNYNKIEKHIEALSLKKIGVEELAVKIFEFFLEDGSTIMNTFKIFLSDIGGVPEEGLTIDEPERFGPPGQKFLLLKVQEELDQEVSEEDSLWAVDMIFSMICHFSLIMNTSMAKERYKNKEDFDPARVKKRLARSARAHMESLKK